MAVEVTENEMHSDLVRHYATRTGDVWAVSWLPGRTMDHSQATSAMVLAERVATAVEQHSMALGHDDPAWLVIDSLAAELDLTGPDAVARITDPDIQS